MSFIVINSTYVPADASPDEVYILEPVNPDESYYWQRVDRNIGWISREEQASLKTMTVGIAGCGGMGGLVAQILLRAGIGTLKIADTEVFDVTNINRQAGATRVTVGQSKALITANLLRGTSDDTTIHVYPRGITETYVDSFLDGCNLVLDEIEYWAVAGRILLHKIARQRGIHLLNCNTVGFGTRLFLFTPTSATIEDCFGLSYDQAKIFDEKLASGTASMAERIQVMAAVGLGLVPEYPSYSPPSEPCGHIRAAMTRLIKEGAAPIIATNPPMASGFLADHTLLYLLRRSGIKRKVVKLPPAPGYLLFDAARMKARVRRRNPAREWWHRYKTNMLVKVAKRKVGLVPTP